MFPSLSKLMFQEDSSKVESKVSSKINDGIDEKAAESGHVTAKFVLDTVSTAIEKSTTTLGQKIEVSVNRNQASG